MAANFGDTIMEGEIAPSVEVQAPVEDKSGLYLAEAANNALTGIGTIFGGVMKANAQNEANSVLVGFREQALLIADAVDQGGIGPQAARTRWRQLYSETLANNPGLAEDLDKLNSTLLSENGIAHVVQTGNEQVQREIELQDSAYAAGWVAPNGQPDVEGYTNFQVATRQLEAAKSELARKTAELGYVSALDEANMRTSVNQWAKAGIPWVDQQIALAAQQIDAGADVAETIAALRADIGTVTGDLSANSQGIKLDHILTPIEQRLTRFEEMATGKLSTEVYNSQLASIKARQEYAYRMDPELGTLLTMSELFGANAPTAMIQQKLNDRASQLLVAASQPFDASSDSNPVPPDLIGSDGDTVAAVKSLQEMLESASVAPTPEVVEEVQTNIINVLRSIKRNQGESPLDYKVVIDMFASQGMGKWAESNLTVPDSLRAEALKVVQNQYENVLLPLVEERYTSAMATLRSANLDFTTSGAATGGTSGNIEQVGVGELVVPHWNGSSVFFQPAPGYEDNATAKGMAASLNEGEDSIAAPLNTLIRAKAHMAGGTDYAAEWEFLAGRLFPEPGEEDPLADVQNTVDDLQNITLGDINGEQEANYVQQSSALSGSMLPPIDLAHTDIEGIDFGSYLPSIRSAESGGNDNADNPTSSAFGRYQFLRGTWTDLVNRYPQAGLTMDGRGNPEQEETAIRLFTAENARYLQNGGVPLSNGSLYAAHFLGAADAVDVLTAPDNELVSNYVPPKVIRANKFLQGMTVGRFRAWAARKGN